MITFKKQFKIPIRMRIISIPYNAGCLGKNKGTEKAPEAILKAAKEAYSLSIEAVYTKVDNSNISASMAAIKDIRQGDIILGGDHSITYKSFIASGCDGIVVFDAHPDLIESKGTHEDWLRNLIDEGKIRKERVIIVGLRNTDSSEAEYIRKNQMHVFPMDVLFGNMEEACDTIMELARQSRKLYLSVDIDAVDPSMAPGTGYIEPGGLDSKELFYFLRRLMMLKNLAVCDIVEVNPDKDVNGLTVSLAAYILKLLSGFNS